MPIDVSKLSDSELSDRLVDLGFPRTPVMSSTRRYLEKQLMTKLGLGGVATTESQSPQNTKQQNHGRWVVDNNVENTLNGMVQSQHKASDNASRTTNPAAAENQRDNGSSTPSGGVSEKNSGVFFAVFCPNDNSEIESRVFQVQDDALKYAKKNKQSRFKSFKSYKEAIDFASVGVNRINLLSPIVNTPPQIPITDGTSRFKGPKSQDLVLLRKTIEQGSVAQVRKMVWENPRYLVSSGDTPSILQEGARYNALHIAARALNSEMARLLLETVSDVKFIQLLYGVEVEENCRQRANFLLDLYLNTPDKGLNETPLHIAAKFGALDVVEVLVSYPECDKMRPNKYLQTPIQIIGERVDGPGLSQEVYKAIQQALQGAYFVPVLRSVDLVTQPMIGEPFGCTKPLVANGDPLSPKMDVMAYAGPMDLKQAEIFHKHWKTPPRMRTKPPLSSARLQDLERGLEREGRDLAKYYHIKWKEYWPFLGVFTDLCTVEGIEKLEEHLKAKFKSTSDIYLKSCELQKGSAEEEPSNPPPEEGKTSTILSPISSLCAALTSCTLGDETPPHRLITETTVVPSTPQHDVTTNLRPILYIEKTCHVLARRMADGMAHAIQTSESNAILTKNLREVLHAEVTNMQKIISSFKSSPDFSKVNFQLIHSRISMLIPYFLDELTEPYELMRMCLGLKMLAVTANNVESSDEEGDKNSAYRGGSSARAAPLRLEEQLACQAQFLVQALIRPGGRSLGLKTDQESEVANLWDRCSECKCTWTIPSPVSRGMRKGASLKRGLARQQEASAATSVAQLSPGRTWSRQEAAQVVQHMPSTEDEEEQSETSDTEDSRPIDQDDVESFYTPPSSITSEEADVDDFECPLEGVPVYLDGTVPTKLDVDVLRALDQRLLSPEQFPNVWRWRHQLLQFSEQERDCLPSPAHPQRITPSSYPLSPPESPSSSSIPPPLSPLSPRTKPGGLRQMWGSPEPPFCTPKRRLAL